MSSIQRQCSIENCDKSYYCRNWCHMHYQRWQQHGDPNTLLRSRHGMCRSAEFQAWVNIEARCYRPTSSSYNRYGARGIKMCEGWRSSFTNFYDSMGKRPERGYSIDRKDTNGHYSCGKCIECIKNGWPFNCRWVNAFVQSWNKKKVSHNTTGYIGIIPNNRRWVARIGNRDSDGRRCDWHLGTYDTKEEAAIAYDIAAIFIRGSEAQTNIL